MPTLMNTGPGVVQRTAFLHMLHGNLGGPGLVATSQALLTSIADRYRYTSLDLCGSTTIVLRERTGALFATRNSIGWVT